MSRIAKPTGLGPESNLLYEILKEIQRLQTIINGGSGTVSENIASVGTQNVPVANAAKTIATKIVPVQNIDATGKVSPAGDTVGNAPFDKLTDGTNSLSLPKASDAKTGNTIIVPVQNIDAAGNVGGGSSPSLNADYKSLASYTSSSTITLPALPADITITNSAQIAYIKVYDGTAHTSKIYVNGNAGYSFGYSALVITLYLNGVAATEFAATNVYEVGIDGKAVAKVVVGSSAAVGDIAQVVADANVLASLGTDGATPPTIAGTGLRGYLRALYDMFVTAKTAFITILGDVAHGSSDSGNPIKIGGKAWQYRPTAVTDGQRSNLNLDLFGRIHVIDDETPLTPSHMIFSGGGAYGSAAFATNATITVTGFPVVVDDATCYICWIKYKPTGSTIWQTVRNSSWCSITASAGTITVTGVTPFASGDTYVIGVYYSQPTIDTVNDVEKSSEFNPLNLQYVQISLADTTNTGAGQVFYPASTGMSMNGFADMTITGKLVDASTDTITVEASNDEDSATTSWVQVYAYDIQNNTYVNSFATINGTFAWAFENFNYNLFRIKVVYGSSTNTTEIKMRMKY